MQILLKGLDKRRFFFHQFNKTERMKRKYFFWCCLFRFLFQIWTSKYKARIVQFYPYLFTWIILLVFPIWSGFGSINVFFYLSGQALGSVFGLPMTGFIAASPMGWPGIFRFYGIMFGLLGVVPWFMAADAPAQHPKISDGERKYIEDELGDGVNTKVN